MSEKTTASPTIPRTESPKKRTPEKSTASSNDLEKSKIDKAPALTDGLTSWLGPETKTDPKKTEKKAAPDPKQDPVGYAKWKLGENEKTLTELEAKAKAGDPEAKKKYAAALKGHSADFAKMVAALPPDKQKELLTSGGADVADRLIKSAQKSGDPKVIQAVIGELMRGGEALGRKNVELLGEVLAKNNTSGVRSALQLGIRQGKGALLAMSTAKNTKGFEGAVLRDQIRGAIGSVNSGFESVSTDVKRIKGEIAATVARLKQAGMSPTEIEAWEKSKLAEHKKLFDKHDTMAKTYASTLEGQGYALDSMKSAGKGSRDREEYMRGMKLTGDLAFAKGTSGYTADALMRKGQGQRTWIDTVKANQGELGEGHSKLFGHVIAQGASTGVGAAAAAGSVGTMHQILDGLAATNPRLAKAITTIKDRLSALEIMGVSGAQLPIELAKAFKETRGDLKPEDKALLERLSIGAFMGGHVNAKNATGLGTDTAGLATQLMGASGVADVKSGKSLLDPGKVKPGQLTAKGKLGILGNAVSLLNNGLASFKEGDWKSIVSTGLSGGALAGDVAAMLGSKRVLSVLSKAALPLGVALSGFDVLKNIADGNLEGAAVASLPLVGAGIGAFFGGPVGAGIGLAVGGVIQGIASLFGLGAGDKVKSLAEKAITGILEKRGISKETAKELAKRFSGEDAAKVNERFGFLAKELGTDRETLMKQLADAPPEYRRWFFHQMNGTVNFEGDEKSGRKVQDSRHYRSFRAMLGAVKPSQANDPDARERRGKAWADHRRKEMERFEKLRREKLGQS